MISELFTEIESGGFTTAFHLASDVDWLYRRLVELPAVKVLRDAVMDDPKALAALVRRTLELFEAPTVSGCLSEYEAAICCYAYVLSQMQHEGARVALDHLDSNGGPEYGWLDLLMSRFLQAASTTTWQDTLPSRGTPPTIRLDANTRFTASGPWLGPVNATSFDTASEGWSGETLRDLEHAE
jgi:hypothetical protein